MGLFEDTIPQIYNIMQQNSLQKIYSKTQEDRLCGLVVRVLDYRSGGPGSIPGTARIKK
jgi:hypothetical protein